MHARGTARPSIRHSPPPRVVLVGWVRRGDRRCRQRKGRRYGEERRRCEDGGGGLVAHENAWFWVRWQIRLLGLILGSVRKSILCSILGPIMGSIPSHTHPPPIGHWHQLNSWMNTRYFFFIVRSGWTGCYKFKDHTG